MPTPQLRVGMRQMLFSARVVVRRSGRMIVKII
jgi:hypothetical protein